MEERKDKKWYYGDRGHQKGPFTADELVLEGIGRKTAVWGPGMRNWIPVEDVSELSHIVEQMPPTPPPMAGPEPSQWGTAIGNIFAQFPKLRNPTFFKSIWIAVALFVVGTIVGRVGVYLFYGSGGYDEELMIAGGIVSGVALLFTIPFSIMALIYIHRQWKLLQPEGTISPGAAVGLLFVPFFNLYWMFVVWHRYAREFNLLADNTRQDPSIRLSLGLSTCVPLFLLLSSLGSAVPGLAELTAIAFIVAFAWFYYSLDRKLRKLREVQ